MTCKSATSRECLSAFLAYDVPSVSSYDETTRHPMMRYQNHLVPVDILYLILGRRVKNTSSSYDEILDSEAQRILLSHDMPSVSKMRRPRMRQRVIL